MQSTKVYVWWSFALRATSLACLLLVCASDIQAQQTFGYVLDVNGEWLLNGNEKLYKGSSVTLGGVITANPANSSSYIVVVNGSGNIFEKRNCRNAGECDRAIRLPRSAASPQSLVGRLVGLVADRIRGQPEKHVSFSSRGADLNDALIKLHDKKIDLSPVFKNLQSDRYLLRFEKLSGNQKSSNPLKPFTFEWDSKNPAPLAVNNLSPGLYRVSIQDVSLLESEDEDEFAGSEAWVLVAAPREYPKAASTFNAAMNLTGQWGTDVKRASVRQFLRATLDVIAVQSKY
jgi:hypothetical protein